MPLVARLNLACERSFAHSRYVERISLRVVTFPGPSFFCALQKKYTGIPANKIPNPTAVLCGYLKIVLITTSQDAATNRKVVTGCPGIRARPFSGVRRPSLKSRRRNAKRHVAVRPKKRKSIDTT